MIVSRARRRGRGAAMVETTIMCSVALILLFALVVGGLGVARFQTVAALAREATRAASVRGGQYRQSAGLPAGTPSDWAADLYSNGVARFPSNQMVNVSELGLDPTRLTYECSWSNNDNWPTRITSDNGLAVGNTVRVTVRYVWIPEIGLFSGVTFASTSEMQITN